jgi:hypothetical protein
MRYVTFRIPLPLPPGPVRINWRRVRSHAIDVAFLVGVSILAALGAALWPSWTMTWGWAGGATVSGILYYRGLRRSPVQYFASARTAIERIVRDSLGFRGWSAPRCFPRGPDEGPHAAYGPFRIVPLGLLGIGITALLGVGIIKALPLLGQKWENKLLGLRKAEARANPIEQMENDLVRDGRKLGSTREALMNIKGQIDGMASSLDRQKKADPGAEYADMERGLMAMRQFHKDYCAKYEQARAAFDAKKLYIERQKFKWGFAQEGQKAMAMLNADDAESMFQALLTDEAYKQVDLEYSRTFAALDLENTNISESKQIEFAKGSVIDVSAIQIPARERVHAKG